MSYSNTHILSLDIKKTISNPIPTFVRNDSATLYIKLTDNGSPYDVSTADRYTVSFERADKQVVTGQGSFENGMLKYNLGSNEMAYEGSVDCVAQFYQGETRISTKPFKIKISHDWEGGIGSETELTLLQELFLEVDQHGSYAQQQGDYAKQQAENLTHKGEYSPTVAYKSNNVLSYGGINYICIKDTTAGILPTDGTYFSIVSPQARFNTKTWTATEGQTVFTITNGSYVINSGNIDVTVGGIPQTSGIGFTETNSTSFTLAEGVGAGTIVFAKWVEGAFSISKTHKSSHEVGGQDELDVTKLKNFDQIAKTGNEYEWTATAGQLTYVLPSNAKYDPNSKWLEVIVGGAPVEPSKIQKDNDSQFTLLVSSSYIPEGVKVVARWVEPYIPATSGHKGSHEAGGYDEIDVTKLKNYSVIESQLAEITKYTVGANQKFSTIKAAYNQWVVDGKPLAVINIKQGTYNEYLNAGAHANNNRLIFRGEDKYSTVWRYGNGEYDYATFTGGGNFQFENLTIVADHKDNPSFVNDSHSAAYAVHLDYPGAEGKMVIKNCILRSEQDAGLGCGTRTNQEIILKDTEIYSTAPSGDAGNHGAILYHSASDAGQVNQKFKMYNVYGHSIYGPGFQFWAYGTSPVEFVAENCIFRSDFYEGYTGDNFEQRVVIPDNTILQVDEKSRGNNSYKLNFITRRRVSDFNKVIDGFFMGNGAEGDLNTPTSDWYIGYAYSYSKDFVVQEVWAIINSFIRYKRYKNGGSWSNWIRTMDAGVDVQSSTRPSGVRPGFVCYDSDLQTMIYWNGAVWKKVKDDTTV